MTAFFRLLRKEKFKRKKNVQRVRLLLVTVFAKLSFGPMYCVIV